MIHSKDNHDTLQDKKKLQAFLSRLFTSQKLAVMATVEEKQPFTNLVAFASTEDLKYLIFATPRATRKFANLSKNPHVALTIDNRHNKTSDFSDAAAVMVIGSAEEVNGAEKKPFLERYLEKHPELKTFVLSPSCALFRVRIAKYDVVRQFQNVVELAVPA
jgi:nitroimidazol reductase NimA-like FMN-containing flavoprotein (pyridoxamine 5'-phosphate oxidase superfamily)